MHATRETKEPQCPHLFSAAATVRSQAVAASANQNSTAPESPKSTSRDLTVAATLSTDPRPVAGNWLFWQLADSAFPTGGFAHSAGLEAAWQHGEVRNRAEFTSYAEASLQQLGSAVLPFLNAAHAEPARLAQLDQLCDAFTSNHVANRASRLQGKALRVAVERIFGVSLERGGPLPPHSHLAPVFGAVARALGVPHADAIRLFVFMHLRGVIAAATRLSIVGPMEGQAIQFQLSPLVETVARRGAALRLDDVAQTAPLLELWQGAHDRLYSRLFQS